MSLASKSSFLKSTCRTRRLCIVWYCIIKFLVS